MKLAHSHVDPHITDPDVEVRIAREAKARDVEMRRQPLIGDVEIDVAQTDNIAEVLGGAVVFCFFNHHASCHVASGARRTIGYVAPEPRVTSS